MNAQSTGIVYDAVHLLGFGSASTEPLPDPTPGEIIIRVGNWSLLELRDSNMSKGLMHLRWFQKHDCFKAKLTPGIYRVRLPVTDSNDKNSAQQRKLLLPDEVFAPAALGASVLICHLQKTGQDLLNGDLCRCAELFSGVDRVILFVYEGRVHFGTHESDYHHSHLWLASSTLVVPEASLNLGT